MIKTKKKVILKFTSIFLFFLIVGINILITLGKLEPTKIIQIPNTAYYYEDPDLDYGALTRFYMVINPPTKPNDLKNFIISYYKKHKKQIENIRDFRPRKKATLHKIMLYKETWNFTRYWKPNLSEIKINSEYVLNQMQEHSKHLIGYLVFYPDSHKDTIISIFSNDEIIGDYTIPHSELE